MLVLAFVLLLQQSSASPAGCKDLSGHYVIQGEDGRVYITLAQTRCTRIAMDWKSSSYAHESRWRHVLMLDGRSHLEAEWYGSGRQLTSAQLRSGKLDIVVRPPKSVDTTTFLWKRVLELLPNGDICVRFLDSPKWSWIAMRAGRQRGTGRAGEDEAVRRSEKGCS
jgi:hypothetical protein